MAKQREDRVGEPVAGSDGEDHTARQLFVVHLNEMRKIFETHRLFLRELTPHDIDSLVDFFTDADAMRYLPTTKDIDGIKDWISLVQKSYDHYSVYSMGI